MKAKEYLKQIHKLEKMIENKMIEREQWFSIATGTSSVMCGERVQTSGNKQKMADSIGNYIDIENEIIKYINDLVKKRDDVISTIEQLDVTEYDVLHRIYVQNQNIDDVSEAYDKTYSWATTLHGRALKHVQNIIDERESQ